MQQAESVNAISIDLVGKLPHGLTELYCCIQSSARALDIQTLIVGAMARDLVLVHGFDAQIERGTRDVDFGINVGTWREFEILKTRLVGEGFQADRNQAHKLVRNDSDGTPWEIDIIPFGPVADDSLTILWPPDHSIAMSVMGFQEAFEHAWVVTITDEPSVRCNVASPAGVALLKLIAWTERDSQTRKKDASDLLYLMDTYRHIPHIGNTLYEEGFAERSDWDLRLAGAAKLGADAGAIANTATHQYTANRIMQAPSAVLNLANDMARQSNGAHTDAEAMLDTFSAAFQQAR